MNIKTTRNELDRAWTRTLKSQQRLNKNSATYAEDWESLTRILSGIEDAQNALDDLEVNHA